jgi:16S rRNA (adenine1518-N6/adenine1519-N6)-dimethyltransferase
LIKAKKRFGQNFLKDESILEKIIQSMPNDEKKIVEIGPGLGDLTKRLLESGEREVVAFEIDLELCDYLQDKFVDQLQTKELTLVCNDVIKEWDNRKSLLHQPYHLIANLPYYVATNIILRALEETHCSSILVMIQKEVAQKFSAQVGDKNFSALSVLASAISDCRILFDVPPECFDPAPKVTSSILWLSKKGSYIPDERYKGLFVSKEEFEKFKVFLRVSFSAPRKTLIKNLKSNYSKELILEYFNQNEIAHNLRPHQLSISHYHLLFRKIN